MRRRKIPEKQYKTTKKNKYIEFEKEKGGILGLEEEKREMI